MILKLTKKYSLTALIILYSFSAFTQSEDKLYKKGQKLFSQKKYTEASISFERALEINPKNVNTHIFQALVNENLKEYKKAIFNLSEAILLGQKAPSMFLRRGICYFKLKLDSIALIDLTTVLEKEPDSYQALYMRGKVYTNNKDFLLAYKDFTQIINNKARYNIHEKSLNSTYYNRGVAYHQNKEYNKAIIDFNQAIKVDSNFSYPYKHRVKTLFRMEKYEDCINYSNSYIKKFPKATNAVRRYKAMSLKKLNHYDEALVTLDSLILFYPKDNVAYNSRADLKLIISDFEGALTDVDISLKLNEKYIPALLTRSEILFEIKNHTEMCTYYNKAIKLGFKPNSYRIDKIKAICDK